MGLYMHTAYKWKTIEDVMVTIKERNKSKRIVNDSLYIKITGQDPLLVWDSREHRNVYMSKTDWRIASSAFAKLDASVILQIPPRYFQEVCSSIGIRSKKGAVGVKEDISPHARGAYFSLDDIYDVSIEVERRGTMPAMPSVLEIKKLFSKGYVPYKINKDGTHTPVWSEGIIL